MAKEKKACVCALANEHLPNCPSRNFHPAQKVMIDFGAIGRMFQEMEERVLEQQGREKRWLQKKKGKKT